MVILRVFWCAKRLPTSATTQRVFQGTISCVSCPLLGCVRSVCGTCLSAGETRENREARQVAPAPLPDRLDQSRIAFLDTQKLCVSTTRERRNAEDLSCDTLLHMSSRSRRAVRRFEFRRPASDDAGQVALQPTIAYQAALSRGVGGSQISGSEPAGTRPGSHAHTRELRQGGCRPRPASQLVPPLMEPYSYLRAPS
jgi:hypothetical protein